jgi:hypothetical protein
VLGQRSRPRFLPAILTASGLSAWLERAAPHADRLPAGLLREARALRQVATRTAVYLNRRCLG